MERFQEYVRVAIKHGSGKYMGTPVVLVAIALLLKIADEGGAVKATVKGNLPRAMVRDIHAQVTSHIFVDTTPTPRSETDVVDLYRIRNVLEIASILAYEDKKFSITTKGSECLMPIVQNKDASLLYEALLFAFLNDFNWLLTTFFTDGADEIQSGVLFSLYILHKKAKTWINGQRLAEYYIRAFPAAIDRCNAEIKNKQGFWNGELEIQAAFDCLFIEMFCRYFGFVRLRKAPGSPDDTFLDSLEVKTTALFDATFKWQV